MRHIAGILLVGFCLTFASAKLAALTGSCSEATASGDRLREKSSSLQDVPVQGSAGSTQARNEISGQRSSRSSGFEQLSYGVHRNGSSSSSDGVSWGGDGDSIPGDELH